MLLWTNKNGNLDKVLYNVYWCPRCLILKQAHHQGLRHSRKPRDRQSSPIHHLVQAALVLALTPEWKTWTEIFWILGWDCLCIFVEHLRELVRVLLRSIWAAIARLPIGSPPFWIIINICYNYRSIGDPSDICKFFLRLLQAEVSSDDSKWRTSLTVELHCPTPLPQ